MGNHVTTALVAGGVSAIVVYGLSKALRQNHHWPGMILTFVLTAAFMLCAGCHEW